jgi:hypothetical protein
MTYTDWSNWWRQRTAAAFNAYFDTDTVQLGITGSFSHQFPMAIHFQNKFHISFISDTTLHLGELPFRPYINPELKSIIEKRKSETAISWFRQTKDKWLTHLWRNRA